MVLLSLCKYGWTSCSSPEVPYHLGNKAVWHQRRRCLRLQPVMVVFISSVPASWARVKRKVVHPEERASTSHSHRPACSASSSSRSRCSPDSPSLFAPRFNRKNQAPGMDVDRCYCDRSRRPPKRTGRGSYREACRTAWSLAARAWAFCFRSA